MNRWQEAVIQVGMGDHLLAPICSAVISLRTLYPLSYRHMPKMEPNASLSSRI